MEKSGIASGKRNDHRPARFTEACLQFRLVGALLFRDFSHQNCDSQQDENRDSDGQYLPSPDMSHLLTPFP